MAWPTRARSNPAGERPWLFGHTGDIASGKLDPLLGSQHGQENGDALAALHGVIDRQVIFEWAGRDAYAVAASQSGPSRQLDQSVPLSSAETADHRIRDTGRLAEMRAHDSADTDAPARIPPAGDDLDE
jgi:hypothetical protein